MIIDDIWRIAIGDSLPEVKQDWISKGYIINHFEAITPKTIPNDLPFGFGYKQRSKGRTTVEFTETEKAIFCSHFALWEKCVDTNRPMIIIEHDTILKRYLPREWDIKRVKYFTKSKLPERNMGRPKYTPAAGYVLTPHGAKLLIEKVSNKFVSANVDAYIYVMSDGDSENWITKYAYQIDHETKADHQ